MKFEYYDISSISDPAIIAKLRVYYRKRDLNHVYRESLISTLVEGSEEGMTASDILASKKWTKWAPERRLAMCKLLDSMVAHGLLPWVKVEENSDGENVYKVTEPMEEKHLDNIP